jgi:hypothetical protein
MESGWDPEVKKFFVKILNTVSLGLMWMMLMVTIGLYFGLAYHVEGRSFIYTIVFYIFMVASLLFLVRHFYKLWKK